MNESKARGSKSKMAAGKSSIDFQQSVSDGKESRQFKNLEECANDLQNSTIKTKKCFSAFKLSTFFSGDREFTSTFGCILTEVETAMEKICNLFKKTDPGSANSVRKELFKESSSNCDLSSIPNGGSVHSLAPPPSEVGSEHVVVGSSRKRKKKTSNADQSPGKKFKKDSSAKSPSPKKESSRHLDKAGQPKEEEEFDVQKINDFVRKQGKEFFHVSWKGYDSDDDTFEPVEHLFGCDEIMENFFLKRIVERNACESYAEFKMLQFPLDGGVREVLFNSFQKFMQPDVKEIIAFTMTCKQVAKTKKELQELLTKVISYREPSLEKYQRMFHNLKMQFGFFNIVPERERQLAQLRAWERSINIICSDPAPIMVENNIDLDLPPLGFVYINDQKAGAKIVIPKDPMIGCKCTDCHLTQNNCCPKGMESFFAYTKLGKLKVSLGTPIYECNKLCVCSQDCPNRVVQKGRRIPLVIFRTPNGRGWGVKAQEVIKKDVFVTEYVGEVISSEEAEQRGMNYDAKGCTYLFDLDYNKGDQNPYTIDAAKYGNVSHFINHSCDPNLVVFNVWVNCLDPDLPRLALFASRDIKKGEELTFDYNSGSTRQQFETLVKDVDEDGMITPKKCDTSPSLVAERLLSPLSTRKNRSAGTTKCLCGAANCRQFFF